jgi:hypothetical protein
MRRVNLPGAAGSESHPAIGNAAGAGAAETFEYWVNVYAGFIDMGGRMREHADTMDRELWQMAGEEPQPRLACRLLRYTPGKGLVDVTPKPERRTNAMSAEARARAAERMREYHRQKKARLG